MNLCATMKEVSMDSLSINGLMNGVRATRQLKPRVGSIGGGSGADSPRSLDTPRLRSGSSALSSPLRTRQGASSPGGDDTSEDSGIRVHRGTVQAMYQDVINIKALLLRLHRELQTSESDSRHETPKRLQNGCCANVDVSEHSAAQQELIADLQRQVEFLKGEVEERDREIRILRTTQPPPPEAPGRVDTCNAATQTDRLRPLSTGPILTSHPDSGGGSFVSDSSESESRTQVHTSRPTSSSRLPLLRQHSRKIVL